MSEFYAPERVLLVFAHADDIEFGVAGTVARWTEAGTQVTYCIVTNNISGSNDPNIDLNELVETRRREQFEAAEVVGVHDVRFLNYHDGILQPTIDVRRDITRVVRDVRPQIVVTFDPRTMMVPENNYINHPDHRATGEATLYAVFPSAETRPIFPELLEEGLEPHKVNKLYLVLSQEEPNLYVDTSSVIERKLEALRRHKSQLDEEVVEMVRKWSHEAGEKQGWGHAEAFRVMTLNETEEEKAARLAKEQESVQA